MPSTARSRPVITLTTDFGVADHYVGVMKGVILGICPQVEIVDISHEVQPFEIAQGAFLIAQAAPYFPPRTIHVVVVDPGVGTARRPIVVEASGQRFVGPDNGVLAMVYTEVPHKVRAVTAEKYFLPTLSRTFHGRDIFAPVAAHLAAGVRPASLGPVVEDHLKPAFQKPHRTSKRRWCGTILHVDRFGNLITSFHIAEFGEIRNRPFEISIGPRQISRLVHTFAEADPGEPFVLIGSSEYLEIAFNQGSAAKLLGCAPGAPVDLSF